MNPFRRLWTPKYLKPLKNLWRLLIAKEFKVYFDSLIFSRAFFKIKNAYFTCESDKWYIISTNDSTHIYTQLNVPYVTVKDRQGGFLWNGVFLGVFMDYSLRTHGVFHTHNFKAWVSRSCLMTSGHRVPISNVNNMWNHGMGPSATLVANWISCSVIHSTTEVQRHMHSCRFWPVVSVWAQSMNHTGQWVVCLFINRLTSTLLYMFQIIWFSFLWLCQSLGITVLWDSATDCIGPVSRQLKRKELFICQLPPQHSCYFVTPSPHPPMWCCRSSLLHVFWNWKWSPFFYHSKHADRLLSLIFLFL